MRDYLNLMDNNGYLPPMTQDLNKETGGNIPPLVQQPYPTMSGNTPPLALDNIGLAPLPGATQITGGNTPALPQAPQASFAPSNVVNQTLDSFINGSYANNARRRGEEFARARGLGNSSIAGGASQRAALESVQPFVGQAMNLLEQREGRAFQGEQAATDRTFRAKLQSDQTFQSDWLSGRQFSREFNGVLSMMPIRSAMDFQSAINNYALENPEVYTPNTISGMTNFFGQNMQALLANFFPNYYGTRPTTNTGGGP